MHHVAILVQVCGKFWVETIAFSRHCCTNDIVGYGSKFTPYNTVQMKAALFLIFKQKSVTTHFSKKTLFANSQKLSLENCYPLVECNASLHIVAILN